MTHPDALDVAETYATAAGAGVFPLAVGTPFAFGDVNVYLIEDDPLTLVDCGPNTATALNQIEDFLVARGHRVTDVELIVVTHEHVDHAGLASALAARSGAELACIDQLAPVLTQWNEHSVASGEYVFELMLKHGIEARLAEALRAVANMTGKFGAPATPGVLLAHGGQLTLRDRSLTVHHLPGHSPSDTVLHDEDSGIAFLGDHLIAHGSANALVGRPLNGPPSTRPEPLLEYRRSLSRSRALRINVGLTGHGTPIRDHEALIDERLRAQEIRAEQFYELLSAGPTSAHDLAIIRWGRVAITQAFMTLSEVLGHLGLLVADGRVVEDASDDVVRFSRT